MSRIAELRTSLLIHVMQVWLTRIEPMKKETSMILRPRPGWEDLRSFISGEGEAAAVTGKLKQRYKTACCLAWRKFMLCFACENVPHISPCVS